MRKRACAWVVLASFLVFSWSCYSWQKVPVWSIKPNEREGKVVSAVQTTSGEKIELRKEPATSIRGDSVVGQRFVTYEGKILLNTWAPFSMPLSEINFVWIRKLNVPVTLMVVGGPLIIVVYGIAMMLHATSEMMTFWLPPVD